MRLCEVTSPNHPLSARPADLVDAVIEAKWMTGEEIADTPKARKRVEAEIQAAQVDLRQHVRPDGTIEVHRGMTVEPGWIERLQPGDELGQCWSYDIRGAFPYNGHNGLETVVFSGVVEDHAVNWLWSIAVHAADEGEIRLVRESEITVTAIHLKRRPGDVRLGPPARPDLSGQTFRA